MKLSQQRKTIEEELMLKVISYMFIALITMTMSIHNPQRKLHHDIDNKCTTKLAHGRNPQHCTWNVNKMREHVVVCFENGMMEPFPLVRQRHQQVSKIITHSIYFTCKMPNDPKLPMICRDKCNAW